MFSREISFLTDDNINTCINECITNSNFQIVIITPWLESNNRTMEKMNVALNKKIEMEIITRPPKKEAHKKAIKILLENGAKIFTKKNLHAKLYLFDKRDLIVASTNLLDSSLVRNNEAAIFTSTKDVIQEAIDYINFLKDVSQNQLEEINGRDDITQDDDRSAFCVDCGKKIAKNKYRPLCYECWKIDNNRTKIRQLCHFCGKKEGVKVTKPLCLECFKSLKY